MAEAMPDWFAILICGGLATLLGLSVLLCAMILDDRRDAAARVLALRGGGDHEEYMEVCRVLTTVRGGLAGCNTVARFCKQCMCPNDYGCESAAWCCVKLNNPRR